MIKPKEKPCKGIGKAKGFGCGRNTFHRVHGLCKMQCYPDWLLNSEQGKIKLEKARLKAIKPRLDLEQAQQERKQNNSLNNLIQSVVNVCHKYIRLRDKGKPCISCGAKWNEHFQAGHFYKAELYSNLRFKEFNIHGQCRVCNLHKDGNYQGYYNGLIERYGIETIQAVESLAEDSKKNNFKWDRETLKKTRTEYNKLIKQL